MMDFVTNVLKIFGIVFLRFRPVPRIWNVWLVGVNLMCLYFIGHLEAQVVLGTTLLSVVVQAMIYGQFGFTRVLGIGHLLWIPMFAWLATRWDSIAAHPDLFVWIAVLAVTNTVSFVIDIADVTRFVNGERTPHYSWARDSAA
ncbi:hypothetical protein [Shimia abyssi]|uniref:Uncharacterized protein n=1 Tax=Shimia abyssi TaxID=1662395 RepID=A0A2P8F7U1_9RHOB|nr:hypothetical protein [Shimia abyssi]PSL17791.1 hypothetical protein CLV88_1141 [Shimia abyssi]